MFKIGDRLICIREIKSHNRIKVGKKFKCVTMGRNFFIVIPLEKEDEYFYIHQDDIKDFFISDREEKLRRILNV